MLWLKGGIASGFKISNKQAREGKRSVVFYFFTLSPESATTNISKGRQV